MNEATRENLELYLNSLYDELGMLEDEIYDLQREIDQIEDRLSCIE